MILELEESEQFLFFKQFFLRLRLVEFEAEAEEPTNCKTQNQALDWLIIPLLFPTLTIHYMYR